MPQTYLRYYTLIALVLCAVDIHFARKAFKKPGKVGRALGWSASFAGFITLMYLLSVNTKNPLLVNISSNLVFIGIDCMLVSLAYFALLVTGVSARRDSHLVNNIIRVFSAVDIAVLLVNIFTGTAVTFEILDPVGVSYRMNAPYVIHLVYTYFIIVVTLVSLIYRAAKCPRQYREQYLLIIAAISLMVAINAIFLFQDRESFFTKVDCSIPGYSLGLYLMYWTAYDYRENDMLNSLARMAMENVNQGIVLFDYTDELIIYNRRTAALLKGVSLDVKMPCARFLEACGIAPQGGDQFSTQCDIEGCVPLRCDYRRLSDKRGGTIGRLFVFTDISRDKDITTGFEYAKDFSYVTDNAGCFPVPTAVAAFDIIGLKDVNRKLGRDAGDRRIRELAKVMIRELPKDAVFLRGFEAYLIALCPGVREADLAQTAKAVADGYGGDVLFGLSANEGRTLAEALETAYRSIQLKKLLSPGSTRSQALASLVRALKEADADTEDHVLRTQRMGAMLGRRIGLTDAELAQQELLCLLHDIGKIGIPLEILNKPGKLEDQEWAVLRTHPEKGYQIAMSSDELKPIAEMVLDHHERWDGKGYPRGLKGEDIPVLSRIISIVDAYDAMVNDRAYRKALKPEAAQEEIRVNAGTQFDPALAREFLSMLSENPALALGEKVLNEEGEQVALPALDADSSGFAVPIAYSRYILNMNSVIIEADARFEEITGYPAAEAVGRMTQLDLIPVEDRSFYLLQVSEQFTHGSMAYLRHAIQRKDGERIQVACYGKQYFDSAVKVFKSEIIIFQL